MPAWADQPHMKAALGHLKQAADQLKQAKPNKGGHRERALELVNSAIQQVQGGIDYVDN